MQVRLQYSEKSWFSSSLLSGKNHKRPFGNHVSLRLVYYIWCFTLVAVITLSFCFVSMQLLLVRPWFCIIPSFASFSQTQVWLGKITFDVLSLESSLEPDSEANCAWYRGPQPFTSLYVNPVYIHISTNINMVATLLENSTLWLSFLPLIFTGFKLWDSCVDCSEPVCFG